MDVAISSCAFFTFSQVLPNLSASVSARGTVKAYAAIPAVKAPAASTTMPIGPPRAAVAVLNIVVAAVAAVICLVRRPYIACPAVRVALHNTPCAVHAICAAPNAVMAFCAIPIVLATAFTAEYPFITTKRLVANGSTVCIFSPRNFADAPRTFNPPPATVFAADPRFLTVVIVSFGMIDLSPCASTWSASPPIASDAAATPSASGPLSSSPTAIPSAVNLFPSILIRLSSVLYRCPASFVRALFSFHALLPIFKASVNVPDAPAALNSASLIRISESPISSRTFIALPPLLFTLSKPWMKEIIAPAASSLNAFLN